MRDLNQRTLVVRADASREIGSGHFMRCLALGQAWRDSGGGVTFVTSCGGEGFLRRLEKEDFDVKQVSGTYPDTVDWEQTRSVIAQHPDAWVVLDGYHFDETYHRRVKEAGHRLLVIDDMAHLQRYHADTVLNQNLHAQELRYACEPDTSLLLGTRYVLLRREFLGWRGRKRNMPEIARHVMVTLGGSDSQNHTLKMIEAVGMVDLPELEVRIVVGAGNPHLSSLQTAAKRSSTAVRLIRNADNMPQLMAWADMAVSTAGTTVWELAFMGVPTLVGISAPAEEYLSRGLVKAGLFTQLGPLEQLSAANLADHLARLATNRSERTDMSNLGTRVVDGMGCARVLRSLSEGDDRDN